MPFKGTMRMKMMLDNDYESTGVILQHLKTTIGEKIVAELEPRIFDLIGCDVEIEIHVSARRPLPPEKP